MFHVNATFQIWSKPGEPEKKTFCELLNARKNRNLSKRQMWDTHKVRYTNISGHMDEDCGSSLVFCLVLWAHGAPVKWKFCSHWSGLDLCLLSSLFHRMCELNVAPLSAPSCFCCSGFTGLKHSARSVRVVWQLDVAGSSIVFMQWKHQAIVCPCAVVGFELGTHSCKREQIGFNRWTASRSSSAVFLQTGNKERVENQSRHTEKVYADAIVVATQCIREH